ncbi:hypothetical protein A2U01_0080705, partial [Trifolium medium]|nr:hypothetical protein [Trifolium medium]
MVDAMNTQRDTKTPDRLLIV